MAARLVRRAFWNALERPSLPAVQELVAGLESWPGYPRQVLLAAETWTCYEPGCQQFAAASEPASRVFGLTLWPASKATANQRQIIVVTPPAHVSPGAHRWHAEQMHVQATLLVGQSKLA